MKNYLHFFSSSACLGVFFLLAGFFAFGTAEFLEHVIHLVPCELCYLERKPWIILFLIGAFILFLKGRAFAFLAVIGCITLCASLGLGLLHIGVEATWWTSPFPSCTSQTSLYAHGSAIDLLHELPALPAKPCDTPDYLLGVPLTLWGFIYSSLCLLGTLILLFVKSYFGTEK